jgi:hypothetical protein
MVLEDFLRLLEQGHQPELSQDARKTDREKTAAGVEVDCAVFGARSHSLRLSVLPQSQRTAPKIQLVLRILLGLKSSSILVKIWQNPA